MGGNNKPFYCSRSYPLLAQNPSVFFSKLKWPCGLFVYSAELIIGTEDFIGGTSMSFEHIDSQQDDSGVSSTCTLQTENPKNNSSIISGVKYFQSEGRKKVCTKPLRKAYQCDLCTKSFTRQGHLTEHKRTHTGEKPYQCEICNKSFTQRGNLAQHLRTHPGEKPFKCDFCVKRFTQRAHLVEHRRIHTGEKPYVCDMCNRGFSQQGHLVAHTRTHTGDKPYICHLCNKRFSSSGYLLVHTRSHLGEKPHKCDFCDKSFMQHRDLVRHSRTHTGSKPYKCEICHKRFPDHGNLARHRRTHAESIHKYVSWKVSNNMEGTLSPALEGHLIGMHWYFSLLPDQVKWVLLQDSAFGANVMNREALYSFMALCSGTGAAREGLNRLYNRVDHLMPKLWMCGASPLYLLYTLKV